MIEPILLHRRLARSAAAHRELLSRIGELALKLPPLLDQRIDPRHSLVGPHLQLAGDLAHAAVLLGEMPTRGRARQRLHAADAGRDRRFADQRDQADLAGAADMRAAAKLD